MTWDETYAAVAALDVAPAVRDCLREALSHAEMAGIPPPGRIVVESVYWLKANGQDFVGLHAHASHCSLHKYGRDGDYHPGRGPKAAALWVAARLKELEGTP